jgi:hypothetical protein
MQLPNMPKKSAAHQKKVDAAVQILETTTGVKVLQAMILAIFEAGHCQPNHLPDDLLLP